MNETTTPTETEVLPPEGTITTQALAIPHAESLAPSMLSSIREGFAQAFDQAESWRQKAMSIKVTDITQTGDMKLARVARLELKNIRVAAEKVRKKLKEESLLMGRAIDGTNAILLAAIVPLEKHLEDQENFAARLLEEQKQRLLSERTTALAPYIAEGHPLPPLADLTPEAFDSLLADYRLLHAAKIEAARRAEEERIAAAKAEAEARAAKEAADAAERERVKIEMERLAAEAAEAAAEAERIAAEREAEREAARIEAERIAAEHAAEMRAQAALRKAEAEAAEREAAARESARLAELAEIAKAKAKAEAEAEAIRLEMERLKREAAAKAKAEAEAAAKAEADAKAKLAAEAKAKADAEAKAARAPDKAKLNGFADTVRALSVPTATTADGKRVAAEIAAKVASFASWIETQTASL